jgi:hypothetical protein
MRGNGYGLTSIHGFKVLNEIDGVLAEIIRNYELDKHINHKKR